MTSLLSAVRDLIAGWLPFLRRRASRSDALPLLIDPSPPESESEPEPEPLPVAALPPPRRPRRNLAERDPIHITDVLNWIPKCRDLLQHLKKHEPEVVKFYNVMGAKLTAAKTLWVGELAHCINDLPGIGMVFYLVEGGGVFAGNFVHFVKLESQPYYAVVPKTSLVMYRVTVAFSDYDGLAHSYDFFVSINDDNRGQVVSQRNLTVQHLPKGGSFTRMDWGVPSELTYHWKDVKRRGQLVDECKSAEQFGLNSFHWALRSYLDSSEDFQIRAERDGSSVAFNVALGRTPYFFKDRETDLTESGQKKKIFHRVEEHQRQLASGKTSTVTAHYRGARKFTWKGERVVITPSERSFYKRWTAKGRIAEDNEVREKMTDIVAAAPRLREISEREWRKGLH